MNKRLVHIYRQQAFDYDLNAAPAYLEATEDVLLAVCNGCGTSGWKGKLVPDTVYGLNIAAACQIHDWDYVTGSTQADKVNADNNFLGNMQIIVNTHGGFFKYLRHIRVYGYYLAVKLFGNTAYWNGKDRHE